MHIPGPCYSRCGPWTNNGSITWELVRNEETQASLQTWWVKICTFQDLQVIFMHVKLKKHYSSNNTCPVKRGAHQSPLDHQNWLRWCVWLSTPPIPPHGSIDVLPTLNARFKCTTSLLKWDHSAVKKKSWTRHLKGHSLAIWSWTSCVAPLIYRI